MREIDCTIDFASLDGAFAKLAIALDDCAPIACPIPANTDNDPLKNTTNGMRYIDELPVVALPCLPVGDDSNFLDKWRRHHAKLYSRFNECLYDDHDLIIDFDWFDGFLDDDSQWCCYDEVDG